MLSLNKVLVAGNLTRDPELKYIPSGSAVCHFGLAINRKYKTKDGGLQDDVVFLDIEAWGKTGEAVAKYLTKGSKALVEGRLKLDSWEKDGVKKSKLKVVAIDVQFLETKGETPEKPKAQQSHLDELPQDDVPF